MFKRMEWPKRGSDDENGPKQRRTRCLGHLVSSFVFYRYLLIFYCISRLKSTKYMSGRGLEGSDEKNGPFSKFFFFILYFIDTN